MEVCLNSRGLWGALFEQISSMRLQTSGQRAACDHPDEDRTKQGIAFSVKMLPNMRSLGLRMFEVARS